MAASIQPIFTILGNMIPVSIAVANTASDGSGTLVTLITAGINGTRVDGVTFRNGQTIALASSAMVCRVFLSDALGVNFKIVGEVALAAATRSASVVGATSTITFTNPIIMKSGQIMSVAQSVYAGAQDLNSAIGYGGDY